MANEEHLKILKQGVEAWNDWRTGRPKINPDISLDDLIRAYPNNADIQRVDLHITNLRGASLRGANLFGISAISDNNLGDDKNL